MGLQGFSGLPGRRDTISLSGEMVRCRCGRAVAISAALTDRASAVAGTPPYYRSRHMLKSALPVLCWAAFLVAGPSLVGAEKPAGDRAKGSQSPEKIVFTLLHEGKVAIRIMNPDGTKQTSVTKADAGEWTPALSPDGKQIALLVVERARSGDMYVMKADGTGRRRLTNSGARTIAYGPAWSPDGKRIAFAEMKIETNGNVTTGVKEIGLFVMDSDGKNRKRLVQGSGSLPAWSPDGKRILYTVTEKSGDTFNFKLHVI